MIIIYHWLQFCIHKVAQLYSHRNKMVQNCLPLVLSPPVVVVWCGVLRSAEEKLKRLPDHSRPREASRVPRHPADLDKKLLTGSVYSAPYCRDVDDEQLDQVFIHFYSLSLAKSLFELYLPIITNPTTMAIYQHGRQFQFQYNWRTQSLGWDDLYNGET